MQQTSLFSYHTFIKPKLGEKQKEVYEALRLKESMTDQEIAISLSWPINCITGRRGELAKLGLVRKAGIKMQNGRPATLWEVGNII